MKNKNYLPKTCPKCNSSRYKQNLINGRIECLKCGYFNQQKKLFLAGYYI